MCDCVCDFVMIWCQTFRIERDRWFCCCDSLCFLQETNGASVRTPTSLRMKDKEAAPSVVVRWQSVPQWKNAQSIFGDIFIQLKLFQMSHFIRASVCILKCCRLMSVFMCLCVHACIRTPDIQVQRGPCGSQAPRSEVRLMTSTEHPGGRV